VIVLIVFAFVMDEGRLVCDGCGVWFRRCSSLVSHQYYSKKCRKIRQDHVSDRVVCKKKYAVASKSDSESYPSYKNTRRNIHQVNFGVDSETRVDLQCKLCGVVGNVTENGHFVNYSSFDLHQKCIVQLLSEMESKQRCKLPDSPSQPTPIQPELNENPLDVHSMPAIESLSDDFSPKPPYRLSSLTEKPESAAGIESNLNQMQSAIDMLSILPTEFLINPQVNWNSLFKNLLC